jgi:DNA-binding PadR family transcriptional regulator
MSLLAILDEQSSYGLRLRNEFEARTGGVWPLNPGQVYTTLDRLERDGLVEQIPEPGPDGQKMYEITAAGRRRLADWFSRPMEQASPSRDELVLKLIMAAARRSPSMADVIQTERRAAIELLQEYTRLKRDASADADLGWLFLIDSLIFQAEARVFWLDACEARLARSGTKPRRRSAKTATDANKKEVKA